MPESMSIKLLADAMLGKLARWLRMLGYDTIYMRGADAKIAHRARAEGRVLLTRDRELSKRRGLNTVLIDAQALEPQLEEVIAAVGPPPSDARARCMACNVPLRPITKDEARPHVPPYVAQTHERFQRCAQCGKVYWEGSHWHGIQARLNEVLDSDATR